MSQAHPVLGLIAARWKEIKVAAKRGETPLNRASTPSTAPSTTR